MEGPDPTLRLIVEEGPLKGQTLEFLPARGSTSIRIGRIARGNTFAIKDAGISTKHIGINFELLKPDSESSRRAAAAGNWIISDLGSSNGTVLNGHTLEPFTPIQLSDGDIIKIGELTTIKVGVVNKVDDVLEEGSKVRRNPPTRRGRGGGGKLAVVDEKKELELRGNNENNDENWRRGEISEDGREELVEVGEKEMVNLGRNSKLENLEGKVRTRRKRKEEEILEEKNRRVEDVQETENVVEGRDEEMAKAKLRPPRTGRGRGRGRGKGRGMGRGVTREEEEMLGREVIQGGQTESSKVITRSMRKHLEGLGVGEGVNVGGLSVAIEEVSLEGLGVTKEGPNLGLGVTKEGVRLDELGVEKEKVSLEGLEVTKEEVHLEKFKVAKERLSLQGLGVGKEEVNLEGLGVLKEGVNLESLGVRKEGVNSDIDDGCGTLPSASGVKDVNSNVVDLEKMTLGEWLDYLEVYLPKQIVDETEAMILGMRQKAEKFHEFMLQQQNIQREG